MAIVRRAHRAHRWRGHARRHRRHHRIDRAPRCDARQAVAGKAALPSPTCAGSPTSARTVQSRTLPSRPCSRQRARARAERTLRTARARRECEQCPRHPRGLGQRLRRVRLGLAAVKAAHGMLVVSENAKSTAPQRLPCPPDRSKGKVRGFWKNCWNPGGSRTPGVLVADPGWSKGLFLIPFRIGSLAGGFKTIPIIIIFRCG